MTIASIADVKARLGAYIKVSSKKPVVITKNGKPVGVLLQHRLAAFFRSRGGGVGPSGAIEWGRGLGRAQLRPHGRS